MKLQFYVLDIFLSQTEQLKETKRKGSNIQPAL
jgi:hypothetical protein